MNRVQQREVARTLLAWAVLVLLVQVLAPSVALVRAAAASATGDLSLICRTVSDDTGGDSSPTGRADHDACPMCGVRGDGAMQALLPSSPISVLTFAAAELPRPAYSVAGARAPPYEPGQPRAPPSLS
jgi:hypothetical protein